MSGDLKLKEWSAIKPHRGPVLIVVMDGVGENKEDQYNAVFMAKNPTYKHLKTVPNRFRTVLAHGKAVGLPTDGDMGNSEVGHNALGAGRIVTQGAGLVDNAIKSGDMFKSEQWHYMVDPVIKNNKALHMIGLLSNGGVHSRFDQMEGIMRGAAAAGVKKIRMHVLLDGRDVQDGSSVEFMAQLEKVCAELQAKGCDARVASGGGRMHVTMDRYEADWKIVERGYKAHVLGDAPRVFKNGSEAIATFRAEDATISDQFLPPFVIVDDAGAPIGKFEDGDSAMNFNFRGDRAIEISRALTEPDFKEFDRVHFPKFQYCGIMQYDGDKKIPEHFLVAPPLIERTSGIYLTNMGVRVFACSETQKFGHVTYFWNGNRTGCFNKELETYVETPSDNCVFNTKPEMKAKEIAELACEALKSKKYDIVRINFANGDMVGHTGDLPATIKACEVVDECVAVLLKCVEEVNGMYIILADHGNADEMVQRKKDGSADLDKKTKKPIPLTSHTLAPVPVFIGGNIPENVVFKTDAEMGKGYKAGLANVTATYINMCGYEAPEDYEPSLLKVL